MTLRASMLAKLSSLDKKASLESSPAQIGKETANKERVQENKTKENRS